MDNESILLLVGCIVLVACVIFIAITLYRQGKIEKIMIKQQAEDKRLREKYQFTTYQEERQKRAQLQYELETLKLREENKKLQDEINNMKQKMGELP